MAITNLVWQSGSATITIDNGTPVVVADQKYSVDLAPGQHLVKVEFDTGAIVEQTIDVPDVIATSEVDLQIQNALKISQGYIDVQEVYETESLVTPYGVKIKVKQYGTGSGKEAKKLVVYDNPGNVLLQQDLTFTYGLSDEIDLYMLDMRYGVVLDADGNEIDRFDLYFVNSQTIKPNVCWSIDDTTRNGTYYKDDITSGTQVAVISYGSSHPDFVIEPRNSYTESVFKTVYEDSGDPNATYNVARVYFQESQIPNIQEDVAYLGEWNIKDSSGSIVDRVSNTVNIKREKFSDFRHIGEHVDDYSFSQFVDISGDMTIDSTGILIGSSTGYATINITDAFNYFNVDSTLINGNWLFRAYISPSTAGNTSQILDLQINGVIGGSNFISNEPKRNISFSQNINIPLVMKNIDSNNVYTVSITCSSLSSDKIIGWSMDKLPDTLFN